jgi:hypothetical protein
MPRLSKKEQQQEAIKAEELTKILDDDSDDDWIYERPVLLCKRATSGVATAAGSVYRAVSQSSDGSSISENNKNPATKTDIAKPEESRVALEQQGSYVLRRGRGNFGSGMISRSQTNT